MLETFFLDLEIIAGSSGIYNRTTRSLGVLDDLCKFKDKNFIL